MRLPTSTLSSAQFSSEDLVSPMRSFFDLFLEPPTASIYRSNFTPTPHHSWVHTSGRSIPSCAFVGGRDQGGEVLYVGRAEHRGSLSPG